MSKLADLLNDLCPDGVEYRSLGEVGKFLRGSSLQKKHLISEGVPCIHYGQVYTRYGLSANETYSFLDPEFAAGKRTMIPGDLFIATTSENEEDLGKAVAWLGQEEAVASNDAYIYRHDLDPMYVSYFFASSHFHDQKYRFITGTKVRRLSGESMSKILIPVPPLEVQQEIVRVLDSFTDLEQSLMAELDLRKKQFEFYRGQLFHFDHSVEWSTLGDVSLKVTSGGTPSSRNTSYYGGDIPWLRTQEVNFEDIYSTGVSITEDGLNNSSAKWIPANCVIVAMYGATAAKSAINAIPLTTNQACCNLQVDPSLAEYRFVYYWVSHMYEDLKRLGEGSQSNLNAKKVKSFPIPVPPLRTQREIIDKLCEFESLISSLEQEISLRRKQYEFYRDELLSFAFKEA